MKKILTLSLCLASVACLAQKPTTLYSADAFEAGKTIKLRGIQVDSFRIDTNFNTHRSIPTALAIKQFVIGRIAASGSGTDLYGHDGTLAGNRYVSTGGNSFTINNNQYGSFFLSDNAATLFIAQPGFTKFSEIQVQNEYISLQASRIGATKYSTLQAFPDYLRINATVPGKTSEILVDSSKIQINPKDSLMLKIAAVVVNDTTLNKMLTINAAGKVSRSNYLVGGSGGSTDTTSISNRIDAKVSSVINWFNAKQAGADHVGIVDAAPLLRSALAAGKKDIYFPMGKYFLSSTVQLTDSVTIRGDGRFLTSFILTGNYPAFNVSKALGGVKSSFADFGFIGTYTNATTETLQTGIKIDSATGIIMNNISGHKLGGYMVQLKRNGYCCGAFYPQPGNIISNSYGDSSFGGVKIDTVAEYNSVISSQFHANQIGVFDAGGNNKILNNDLSRNIIGIKLTGGSNDGHGLVSGNTINHCTKPLHIDGLSRGMWISDNTIYTDNDSIIIRNSTDVIISGGFALATIIRVENCSRTQFQFMGKILNATPTYSITGESPVWIESNNASAALELRGTGKGFLMPRMNTAQRPASPTVGNMIFNTDSVKFEYYNGSAWIIVGSGSGGSESTAWGNIPGTLSAQTDLNTALGLKAPLASPTFTGTVSGITKAMVALGNVDNTADASKPVSTAQQNALDLKANLASPTLTGSPLSPTPASTDSSGKIATTAYVKKLLFDSLKSVYIPSAGALKYNRSNVAGVPDTMKVPLVSAIDSGAVTPAMKTAWDAKEAALGNPGTNGYVLASTTSGTRSWVAASPGGSSAPTFNSQISILRDLGSTIKGITFGNEYNLFYQNAGITLTSGRQYFCAVHIDSACTLTGIKWAQAQTGSYTATGGRNTVSLWSYAGGTLTQVATSTADGTLWSTAAGNAIGTKAFSSTYSAAAGTYYAMIEWSASSTTTAPQLYGYGDTYSVVPWMSGLGFTNSAKIRGYVDGAVSTPQAMSGVTAAGSGMGIALFVY